MLRSSVAVRVVGILLCCAACRPAAVPVSQDLTTLRAGFSGDRVVPVRVQGDGDDRRLVRAAAGELDIYVRLPEDAELRYRLPADQPAAGVALSAVVGGAVTPLVPAAVDGEWRVALPADDGGIAALRLTVPEGGRTVLVAPRVVGEAAPVPAILPHARVAGGRRPNVVLYVVDTLRTDRMSLYGYARPTSPELERRAGNAYVFEQAYAAGSFTAPSVTALLASRRASEMRGVMNPAGAARTTLAEAFRGAGYATAAFQANLLCTTAGGYDRGFDTYELVGTVTPDGLGKATAAELHARALDWVDAHRAAPFFLYLQSMDVHFPYAAPEPFRDRFVAPAAAPSGDVPAAIRSAVDEEAARVFKERLANLSPDRYDGGVAYADHELGRLLDALAARGLAENTIVVVTADHGEPLGDRREIFHGRSLWNELVRVPLVMWVPELAGGVRVDEVVSLLDVAPTLVELAGLPVPPSFVGRSWLVPASAAQPPGATGELVRGSTWTTVGWYAREGPWKLILDREKGPALYHLPTDPRETTDVSATHPEVTRYLVGRATAMPPPPAGATASGAGPPKGLSDEDRRRREDALRALGYVDAH
jgi:arylsulfatase A-like enzyme